MPHDVSPNRNKTLTIRRSHDSRTVEFRYGFKLLRLAHRFQTLTIRVTVSTPYGVRISFRFLILCYQFARIEGLELKLHGLVLG